MRILVLNYEFPPVGGGGGRFTESLCRALSRRGHEIRVQTAHIAGLPRLEQRDGYTIYRTPSGRKHRHTCTVGEMGIFLITNMLPVLRHVMAWKPDFVHAHFAVPTGVLAWWAHRLTGIPYVLTVQLGDVPGGNPDQTDHIFRWIKPMTVPIWHDAAGVVVPSDYIRHLAFQSYRVPMTVIPNGVETSMCQLSPLHPYAPRRLIFVGRFNPQKNLLFLIDLLAQVADVEWELHLLGDGPMMAAVRTRVMQFGLDTRVRWYGWVEGHTVSEVMSQSDILVLPSTSEGLPVVGVQALAHGLAILGSDIGGLQDVVIPGWNGFLCRVDDSDAFESALRLMLTDERRLRSMKQVSRVMARQFDLEHVASRYEQFFITHIGATRERIPNDIYTRRGKG